MRTGSNRALARALGVSETAVRKAEKAGRIRRAGDGSWEVDRVKAAWQANTDASQQRAPSPGLRPVPEAAVGAVRETLRGHGESVPAGGMTFLQARTANEVLKAQERKLRLGRLKGELVDRARTTALVFRLARAERDAWLQWPARIAATLAAELGVEAHAMQTVLERSLREQLEQLAEPRLDLR
ncbi:MAG: elements of external origin [Geminicoccaceae bacterium]